MALTSGLRQSFHHFETSERILRMGENGMAAADAAEPTGRRTSELDRPYDDLQGRLVFAMPTMPALTIG